MRTNLHLLQNLTNSPLAILQLATILILTTCILAIFASIYINFQQAKEHHTEKRQKKSIVETGSMTGFFVLYYILLRFQLGVIILENIPIRITIVIIGLLIVIFGTYFNIKGRLFLGKQWANQIKIYKDHKLITEGPYKIVRHPLYASLIWMFFGGSIIYLNYSAFLANLLIFIPFMYYRAKQEEKLLEKEFNEYKEYRRRVGMFFPKFISLV